MFYERCPPPDPLSSTEYVCWHPGNSNSSFDAFYIPEELDPIKTVRIVLHVMQKSDGSGNFQSSDPNHMTFLNGIFGNPDGTGGNQPSVNKIYSEIPEPVYSGSPTGDPYLQDSRIRFDVVDILFHQDDLGWSNNGYDGGSNNDQNRYCLNNYGVATCNSLNVFLIGRYEPSYTSVAGVGPGLWGQSANHVMMQNMYFDYLNHPPGTYGPNHLGGRPWIANATLAHEVGHCGGFVHSWDACSQFPDMDCPQTSAWCSPSQDLQCTNNLMGYSTTKRHLTPLQLGHIHEQLSSGWRKSMLIDTYDPTQDVVVSSDETWDFARVIRGNIIVESGVKLTIMCMVSMPFEGRIIVKQNAELIIDGGEVTNYSDCSGRFWQGIELWGDSDEPQISYGSGYKPQAILRLKNGGIIENAWVGVTTAEIGNPDASGGIIDARDGEFLNNYIAVDMKPFENTSQYTGNPKGNLSSFKETKFTVNDDYIGDLETEYPEAQVKMWGVDGVTFAGCEFVNTSTVSTSEKRSKGIFSESAQYHIYSACATIPSQQTGCPTEDVIPTLFDGFNRGIEAAVYDTPLPILVRGTKFTNNMIGIELNDLAFSEIIRSDFEIGGHPHESATFGPYEDHLGIYSNQTRCFVIEENEFYKDVDAVWGKQNGVLVYQSEDNSNNVYRNDFSDLEHAAIGYQVNRDDNGIIGLQLTCNEMTNNYKDFIVSRNTLSPNADDAGIREFQGNLNPTLAAGNTFSVPNGAPNDYTHWDINSDFNYHYYHSSGMAPDPNELTPNKIFPIQLQYENQCFTNYHPVGRTPAGGIEGVFQVFNQKKSEYYGLLYTYRQIIDQGDTEGTIHEIIATWPEEAWDLYDMLMARSPNNSETVLISAADREIMPHAMLLEVLLANPDALRNGRIAYHVEHNLTNPMPGYMIDILNAASNQTTMRTVMENALSHHHAEMSRNYNFIIQHYTTDTLNGINNDSLLYYLEQMDSPTGKYNLAGRLMGIGNHTGALNIIDSIPLNFKLSASQTNEWEAMKAFFELLEDANRNGRNIATLDSTELVTLELIATDLDGGIGALRARKALCFFYQNCIDGPALPKNYSAGHQKPLPPLEELLSALDEVSAFPNPASEYVTFSFQFFNEKGERDFLIYNSTGSLVQSYQINDVQQGQQLWDTRKMKPGTYLYKVLEGDHKVHSGKIVIQ